MPLALLPTQRCGCFASQKLSFCSARVLSVRFRTFPLGFEVSPAPHDRSWRASTTQIPAGGGPVQSLALRGVEGRGAPAQP